jgi:hypothetical protein
MSKPANLVLAHRLCNIRRGAGRHAVQAPLFSDPTPPPGTFGSLYTGPRRYG